MSVLFEKSVLKVPLFSFIPLIVPVVNDPLPEILSPNFNLSLSDPNTTSSPSDDLTTFKSASTPLTLRFSPAVNGEESNIILNVGVLTLGY